MGGCGCPPEVLYYICNQHTNHTMKTLFIIIGSVAAILLGSNLYVSSDTKALKEQCIGLSDSVEVKSELTGAEVSCSDVNRAVTLF